MCGFAGVVAWDDRYRVDRETLRKMSARVAHRGPDGEGLYLNHEQEVTADRPQVGLVHRRLAIIDPDPRANQPFTDGQGRWLVYNGEIYNFRELRAELKKLKPEYEWRTDCDTEVLVVAYGVWGEKCVEHFSGMFAFAVWDENAKTLYLARDRMGQKPLYHTQVGSGESFGAIAFASELSALRELAWVEAQVHPAVIKDYLRWGYVPHGMTAYTGIQQLAPATGVRYGNRPERKSYFDPNLSGGGDGRPGVRDPVASTRHLVRQAVSRQLVSDVPLGCFLSGGVDSSVIAASMRAAVPAGQRVLTFSIAFADPRYDESQYAARVARHLGTEHHCFTVTPNAAEDLPKLAAVFGEPFGDSSALPTHYLARETRRHVIVALSGDGGDELFGGYDRYRAMQLARKARAVRGPISALAGALPGTHPKSAGARAKRFARSLGLTPADRYASYVSIFDNATLLELFAGDPNPGNEFGSVSWDFRLFNGLDDVQRALAVDRQTYLPDDLLTKVDRASMLHALEVRSPFMDHELVQFAAGLTTDQLLKGGPKRMLREAFAQDLPAWVFKRKKMGFAVPIGEWFRGELRPMLRDHLFAADAFARGHFQIKVVERLVDEHETQQVDHSQRLYALLMLELWWRGLKTRG
jgi:asparagine synthase (glutamine-hydrolysing)